LIVGLVVAVTTTACSTMDDVKISNPCDGAVTVLIDHLEPDGTGGPTYVAATWDALVGPDEVAVVAGIVNMGSDDLVSLYVDISGWNTGLTRSELRDRGGLITLPPEACP
jgi:hypothetical protein